MFFFNISDVFKFDSEYETNEEKYSSLRKEILDEGSSSSENGSGLEEEDDSEEESENGENKLIVSECMKCFVQTCLN
jgi:pre-mRNA-splicing factor CWC22